MIIVINDPAAKQGLKTDWKYLVDRGSSSGMTRHRKKGKVMFPPPVNILKQTRYLIEEFSYRT